MGLFGNTSNQPVPIVDHSAAGPAPAPSIDGVIAPVGGTPAPAQDFGTPIPVAQNNIAPNDAVGDYIMTDPGASSPPAPTPIEPSSDEPVSPAYNEYVGAPVTSEPTNNIPVIEPPTLHASEPEFTQAVTVDAPSEESSSPEKEKSDEAFEPAYPELDELPEASDEPALANNEPEIHDESDGQAVTESDTEQPPDEFQPEPVVSTTVSSDTSSDLGAIKQQALQQLTPLVNHLNQNPEEKFNTTMMMLQATDDQSLVSVAYEAAQAITDEKAKAQALLDIINEINYFNQKEA